MWLTTQEFDFVSACNAIDLNGVSTAFPCAAVNMGKYTSLVAIANVGAGSTYRIYMQYNSTSTITAGSTGNMCIGQYRYSTGTATTASTADTLSAYASLTTTGSAAVLAMPTTAFTFTSATGSSQTCVYIELKSDDLPDGYPYVALAVSTSAQSHIFSANYVCKPRYLQNTMLLAGS